jgi:uncharacterized membrane protein YdjX (TVP38/TMEM64 family)
MLSVTETEPEAVCQEETGPNTVNWGRYVVLAAILAAIVLFFTFGPDERTVIERSGEWRQAARSHLLPALAVFFAVEVAAIALSLPVGVWLSVLAGFLFGTWLGTAVVNLASTLGAVLAFLAARYLFAAAIHQAAETRPRLHRWIMAIDSGFREHGAYYVILLRLTPVIPFFVVNAGLGLTSVRLRDYWWATQLGMLPITLVVANAGESLSEITSFREVLSWRVLGALSLLPLAPFILHHTLGRWLSRSEPATR